MKLEKMDAGRVREIISVDKIHNKIKLEKQKIELETELLKINELLKVFD